jgi:hypothetical protein
MRCSYCGGLNSDQATFCARCGRNLVGQPAGRPQSSPRPQVQPPIQAPQAPQSPAYPSSLRSIRSGRDARNAPQPPASPVPPRAPARLSGNAIDQSVGMTVVAPAAPEAPAPFPPRTVEHLYALEQGALAYTQIGEDTAPGGKKVVRILFARCAYWQQVATLLRAYRALRGEKFSTLIIRGVYNQNDDQRSDLDSFNNGQLIFDRGVRLGSQTLNRYQIETGTGFESEAMRIVLTE